MNRFALWVGLVGMVILAAPDARAADPPNVQAQVDALEKAVAKDEAASPADPNLQRARNYVRSIEGMVQREEYAGALQNLSHVSEQDPSSAVQDALNALSATLQAAQTAEESAAVVQVKKILDDATAAVKSARDPKEIDPILSEMAAAMSSSRNGIYNVNRAAAYGQLQPASEFMKRWQSYLVDEATGNAQMASNDLRDLAQMESNFIPIPRSELLERALKESGQVSLHPAAPLAPGIEIHSFDDIPGAIAQVEALERNGNFSQEMNNLLNALQNLRSAYLAYQEKNYNAAMQQLTNNPFFGVVFSGPGNGAAGNGGGDAWKELSDLKNQLLVQVVQAVLALPDLPAPQPGERAADYLLRMAAAREKAGDWAGLQQVLVVYQQVAQAFNGAPWLQEDLAGLHAYLVGEKLESAGQNLDAIRSYRQALATIGKFFPADPPAGKLNELQKKYPDLYQQALQQPITPRGM